MAWYHLRESSGLSRIVRENMVESDSDLEVCTPYWLEQLPEYAPYREPSDPRVCVAPSVWQCLSALGRSTGPPTGRFFIYELEPQTTTEPTRPPAEGHISDERWIIDRDVEATGGSIALTEIGWIDAEHPFALIKMNTLPGAALDRMKAEADERQRIWTICASSGEWVLSDRGLAEIRTEAGL